MDTTPDEYLLYLRQSKGRAGIARQRRETIAHLEKLGRPFTIGREFSDKDRATAFRKVGGEHPERADFEAMLTWSATHPDARIAAWHADRLVRDPGDTERMIHGRPPGQHLIVETRGGGTYDLSTALGRKRLRQDAIDAAYEVDHAIERITALKREHAAAGQWSGSPRPFGWEGIPAAPGEQRKFAGLRIRESEASLIRSAARAVLSGTSLAAIARQWNAAGVTGTLGGRWNGNHVRRMLLRPRNAGICYHLGAETATGDWPPILPEGTFRALQAHLTDPARTLTPGPERRWLGTGFYQCGVCHAPLRTHHVGAGSRNRAPRPVYRCAGHVARSAHALDAWVGDLIAARLATASPAQIPGPQGAVDAGVVHGQILAQRQRMDQAAGLFASGAIDATQLAAITAAAREQTAALRRQLAQAARASVTDGMPATAEEIRAWWDTLHVSRQRAIAAEQFVYVRVMPARHGRPPGSRRGEPYFDRSAIKYEWR